MNEEPSQHRIVLAILKAHTHLFSFEMISLDLVSTLATSFWLLTEKQTNLQIQPSADYFSEDFLLLDRGKKRETISIDTCIFTFFFFSVIIIPDATKHRLLEIVQAAQIWKVNSKVKVGSGTFPGIMSILWYFDYSFLPTDSLLLILNCCLIWILKNIYHSLLLESYEKPNWFV